MTTSHIDEVAERPPAGRVTEAEFEAWALRRNVRAEWVDSEVILMSPVNWDHYELTNWLVTLMRMHASKHRLGSVGGSELMVRLPSRRRLPDILFVRREREEGFKRTYFEGAPDMIVEVVSPDSENRDWREKYLEYQSNGVGEYWVIDSASSHAEFYALRNGRYEALPVTEGVIRSEALAGFWLKTEWLWKRPLPNDYEVSREIGII